MQQIICRIVFRILGNYCLKRFGSRGIVLRVKFAQPIGKDDGLGALVALLFGVSFLGRNGEEGEKEKGEKEKVVWGMRYAVCGVRYMVNSKKKKKITIKNITLLF
jgi:hypothetical protein